MTKEEITPAQAMQYLEMLVALDNTQIAKDTLEYSKKLQAENKALKEENKKSKKAKEFFKENAIVDYAQLGETKGYFINCMGHLTKEQYEILKEWLENE